MEGEEHAPTDAARDGGGYEEKPGGEEAAKSFTTRDHSLRPRDDPGRPTRSRQAKRRLRDYVRAVHAATIEQSSVVLENVEYDSKLTRNPVKEVPPR